MADSAQSILYAIEAFPPIDFHDAKKAFYDVIKANGGGSIYQSDSLADLAGRFNLDADALEVAVDRYNELCGERGADSDFGKAADLMVAIETPPFCLAKLSHIYFFSVGGIATDGRHRVLDGHRNPIEGLYAIGNDGNMLYRNVYATNLSGVAFGHRVNSGREAANAVLEYLDR